MAKERFKVCCAVYMIIRKDNKILFLKRQNTGYMDNLYALPAGHLEEGESITQALIREAQEEIGIVVKEENVSLVFTGNQIATDKEYLDLFFEIKDYSGILKNNEPDKASELAFYEIDEIFDKIIPYTAKVLQAIDNGRNHLVFYCWL